ncbi:COG1470 family protein [Natrarchaeobius oligotrophus]|uniref:COG1470 family protein n=1 Tax=Natrarchaeobius oligotrophus TaxID=3455743 RepID=UPI001FB344A6|nr:hypothetical protein [Natrarchaeobius chitinivorans]
MACLVALVLVSALVVVAPTVASAGDDHEDEYVVVRFADDYVVTESAADEVPPNPNVSVEGTSGDEALVVNEDGRIETESGQAVVVENNTIQTISGDPNLVVTADGVVNDTLEVNGDGYVETSEGGSDAVVENTGDRIVFEEYDEAYFNVTILDGEIESVGEGETLTVPVEITNDGYGTESEDVTFELFDESGGVIETIDEDVALERGETTTIEFEYETSKGDRSAESVEVTADTNYHPPGSGVDTADVTIHESETVVSIVNADELAPAAGDELEVTAEIERRGNYPQGEQDVLIEFRVDGEYVTTEPVTLGPGERTTETFTYQTSEDDSPGVSVELISQDGDNTASANVDVIGEASFNESVTAAIVDRNYPDEGDELVITGEIGYTGVIPDSPQEHPIQLYVDGELADEKTVELDGDEWVEEEFTYQTEQGDAPRVDVELRSPGEGDTARPLVAGSGFAVDIQNVVEPVNVTDRLVVTAAIENTGDIAGEQDVRLRIDRGVDDPDRTDRHVRDNSTVSLEPGERTVERFSFRTWAADVPQVEVAVISNDDEDVANATVRDDTDRFDVTELSADRSSESTVDLSATINNTGIESGEQYVELLLGDEVVHIDRLELGPWESQTLTATADAPDETIEFAVVTDNATETTTVAGVEDADDEPDDADETDDDPSETDDETTDGEPTEVESADDEEEGILPWYLVVLGILGVAGSVLVLLAYRNDPENFPPDAAAVKAGVERSAASARQDLTAAAVAARDGDVPALVAALKGLVGIGPGTLVVQNQLPRAATVRVRCQTAHDTVLLEDLELDPDERRALGALPNVSQFKVGAGVEDITAHEEIFQGISGDVGVVLRADGILIANLG